MKYGLKEEQWNVVREVLSAHPEIEQAVLFGSRAVGDYKEASDVDLALKGEGVDASLAAGVRFEIEEDTWLPFFFDVVAYSDIQNPDLRKQIDEFGKVIYEKGSSISVGNSI